MIIDHISKRGGVYILKCVATKKIYVGFSKSMFYRVRSHVANLSRGMNEPKQMIEDWNNYPDDWICAVREFTPYKIREVAWIRHYKSYLHENGYNVLIGDGVTKMDPIYQK